MFTYVFVFFLFLLFSAHVMLRSSNREFRTRADTIFQTIHNAEGSNTNDLCDRTMKGDSSTAPVKREMIILEFVFFKQRTRQDDESSLRDDEVELHCFSTTSLQLSRPTRHFFRCARSVNLGYGTSALIASQQTPSISRITFML